MSYVKPQQVLSPRRNVGGVLEVVHDPGEGLMAVARILWNDQECVALRWNGNSKQPLGNPMSRRQPTWFVVSGDVGEAVLQAAREAADKSPSSLQAQYRAMSQDHERELEAKEWSESLLRDFSGE